jgi:hypothetical protein
MDDGTIAGQVQAAQAAAEAGSPLADFGPPGSGGAPSGDIPVAQTTGGQPRS